MGVVWLAVFALVLAMLTVPVAGAPARAAGASGVGWRAVWASDFSGSAVPSRCTTYGSPHGGQADSYYTPDEVRVSGGLLRLGMRKSPKNGRNYATGGITCYRATQRYGKFEYRAKVPLGAGIDAYSTLWQGDVPNDNVLIEILAKPGAQRAYLSSNHDTSPVSATIGGTYTDTFHTYTIEWSPGLLRILIDGTLRLTDRHPGTAAKWIGWAVSSGDALTGEPDSATKLPTEFDVDWVRVYAYVPGAAPAASLTRTASPAASAPASSGASAAAGTPTPGSGGATTATPGLDPALVASTNSGGSGGVAAWLALPAAAVVLLLLGYVLLRRRVPGRHTNPRAGTPTDRA